MKNKEISSVKLEKFDNDIWRLVEDELVVALILRTANNRWKLMDAYERPLSSKIFDKPRLARNFYLSEVKPK